jgi:hypothetical protein
MAFSGVRQRCGRSLLTAWLGRSRSDKAMVACGGALMAGQKRKAEIGDGGDNGDGERKRREI